MALAAAAIVVLATRRDRADDWLRDERATDVELVDHARSCAMTLGPTDAARAAARFPSRSTGYPERMPYILSIAIVAVAVVLGIFTGVWGGLAWIFAAAAVLVVVFALRARDTRVSAVTPGPTGRPRTGGPGTGTANERVGQG